MGIVKTHKAPGFNQRYRCKECGSSFSYNTFSIDFRKKYQGLGYEILYCSMHGMSNNSIARKLKVSEKVVRERLASLARQGMLALDELERDLTIKGAVSYDGFETFSYSQFSPCYINTAVTCRELYTLKATFSPLNRKGRMTEWQKKENYRLIEKHGPYPRNSVQEQSLGIFRDLSRKSRAEKLILHTDEHKAYECALRRLGDQRLCHVKTNSKERRDPKNPLFPVNHLHLSYRHFLAAQRRETIAFQKNEAALMDKIILMRLYKNFMREKFVKMRGKKSTPAMEMGLSEKVLGFDDIFERRRFVSHHELGGEEMDYFRRKFTYSRRTIRAYDGM